MTCDRCNIDHQARREERTKAIVRSPWVANRADSTTAAKARVEPTLGDRIRADR